MNLLEPLEIVTEFGVHTVGEDLVVLAVDNVSLSVEEPDGDLVLSRVLYDGDDSLELFGCEFTGALVQVDVSLLADKVGVAPSNTLDLGQGVHDLLLSIDIGVEETQNELEI